MKVSETAPKQRNDATPIPPAEKRQTPGTVVKVLALIFLIESSETYGTILNDIPNNITGQTESHGLPEFEFYIKLNNICNESFAYNKNNEHPILITMSPRNESFDRLSKNNLNFTKQEFNLSSIHYSTIIDRSLRNYSQEVRKDSENPIRVRRMNFIEKVSAKLASESILTECLSIQNTSIYYGNKQGSTELHSNRLFNTKRFECNRDRFLSNSISSIFFNWANNISHQTTNLSAKKMIITHPRKKRELFQRDFFTSSKQKVKKLRHSNKCKVLDVEQKTIKIKRDKNTLQKKGNKIINKAKFSNQRKIIKNNNLINMTFEERITSTKSQNVQPQENSIVNGENNNKTNRFNGLASNKMIKTSKNYFTNDSLNGTVFRSYEKREGLTNITNQSSIYSETLSRSTIFDSKLSRPNANQVIAHSKTANNRSSFNFLFQVEYITTNKHTQQSQSNNIISSSDRFTKNKKDFNQFFTIDNLFEQNYADLDHIDVVMQRTTPFLQSNIKRKNKMEVKSEKETSTSINWSDLMKNEQFDAFLDFDSLYQQDVDVDTVNIKVVTDTYFNKNNDRDNTYTHYDAFINCSNLADNFLLIRSYTTIDPCRTTFSTTVNNTISNITTTTHKVSSYIIEEKFFSYDVIFATIVLGFGMLLITTAICCCCINMMLS